MPKWLWPNLLSLDAPLVALVWMEIIAKAFRVQSMQWESRGVVLLCVWVIYVVDRLLDARKARDEVSAPWMRKRHAFHQRYFGRFVAGVVVALALIVWMLMFRLGPAITWLGGEPLVMTAVYLFIASLRRPSGTVEYFKNLVAGMTFAVGVTVPVCYHAGIHDFGALLFNQPVLFFGVLATLNITAIDLWEHAALSRSEEEQDASEVALSLPLFVLAALSFYQGWSSPDQTFRWAMYAVFIGAALLQALNHYRERLGVDSLRALADLALVLPYGILTLSTP